MHIKKVVIKNFKSLRDRAIVLNPHMNVIVGDNETGKSSLLEAVNLALTYRINGRNIQQEMNPHLFNKESVNSWLQGVRDSHLPPAILIELYLNEDKELASLRGTNNSLGENCPGISLKIQFDEDYSHEYRQYVEEEELITEVPIEFYEKPEWFGFDGNVMSTRRLPLTSLLINTGFKQNVFAPHKHIIQTIDRIIEKESRAKLSLAYRRLREDFMRDEEVKTISNALDIGTEKEASISLDLSGRSTWQNGLALHLDDIPFSMAGMGEQAKVHMALALSCEKSKTPIILIEEPENHLSHTNLHNLLRRISDLGEGKQILVTTHNGYVLSKLGVSDLILFGGDSEMKLSDLSPATRDYFMKMPGHDTLRLILAKKAMLVEGPSDELIFQRAYLDEYGRVPLEDNIEVIAVRGLSFKRFLEIAEHLKATVGVLIDNDGNVDSLKERYSRYLSVGHKNIHIFYSEDEEFSTLEPQIVAANSKELLSNILVKDFESCEEILDFMASNKSSCALKILESDEQIQYPDYIQRAVLGIGG